MEFRWTMIYEGQPRWVGVVVVIAAVLAILAVIFGLMMLPGLLFGSDLPRPQIQTSVRGHLFAQAARGLQGGSQDEESRKRYEAEIERIKTLKFVDIDVDTVIFSAFRARRSYVVEVVMEGGGGARETRYFCFLGNHLSGECARWNWYLAW
jgi:hypothetical protein